MDTNFSKGRKKEGRVEWERLHIVLKGDGDILASEKTSKNLTEFRGHTWGKLWQEKFRTLKTYMT
jgi:hypothetical protein